MESRLDPQSDEFADIWRIQRRADLHYLSRVLAVLQSLLVLPLGAHSVGAAVRADEDGAWRRALDQPATAAMQSFIAGHPGSRDSIEAFERLVKAEIEAASPPVQEALLLLEVPEEILAEGPY